MTAHVGIKNLGRTCEYGSFQVFVIDFEVFEAIPSQEAAEMITPRL
jgi:hypothetical protein